MPTVTLTYSASATARRSFVATFFLLLTMAGSAAIGGEASEKTEPRAQLSVGYSLLYQEADGIPKLKWLLMFKSKSAEVGKLSKDLSSYYQKLADSLQKLSAQYPAVRIDADTMPKIEADTRKAIGEDLARDIAPIAGKSGVDFERTVLLTFYSALDEQRHLVGQMTELETVAPLKKFLDTTKADLDAHYARVGRLLNRRYFTH